MLPEDRRSRRVALQLRPEEYAGLARAAELRGEPVAVFARAMALRAAGHVLAMARDQPAVDKV